MGPRSARPFFKKQKTPGVGALLFFTDQQKSYLVISLLPRVNAAGAPVNKNSLLISLLLS